MLLTFCKGPDKEDQHAKQQVNHKNGGDAIGKHAFDRGEGLGIEQDVAGFYRLDADEDARENETQDGEEEI